MELAAVLGLALAKARYRKAAVDLLDAIESDESIQVVALSETLWGRAYRLYRERRDKAWG